MSDRINPISMLPYDRNPESTVYVGNIDTKVSLEILWELFSQCGIVVSVHLPRDKVAAEHQGYGFIEFKTEEDADYSIKILHMIKLYGKPIKVNKASSDRKAFDVGANLFIGNLEKSVDEKQLFDTFSAFGLIVSTRIQRDPLTGESKGYGFVSYDNFDSSDSALQSMDGQFYFNKVVHISYAYKKDSKGERHGSAAERLLAANRPGLQQKNLINNQMNMQRQPRFEQQNYQQQIPIQQNNNFVPPPQFPPNFYLNQQQPIQINPQIISQQPQPLHNMRPPNLPPQLNQQQMPFFQQPLPLQPNFPPQNLPPNLKNNLPPLPQNIQNPIQMPPSIK